MKTYPFLIIALGFSLILSGCNNHYPQEFSGPIINFPNRDIVFEANYGKKYALGFINADGSSPAIFPTGSLRITLPVWSQDKKRIYFHTEDAMDDTTEMEPSLGGFGILQTGYGTDAFFSCENDWTVYPTQSEGVVFYSTQTQLGLLNINGCKPEKILVDFSKRTDVYMEGFSLSRDQRFILYSEFDSNSIIGTSTINRLDLQNGETQLIGEGTNAVISPNGRQISFVRPDGIYLMNFDGSSVRKLVDYRSINYPTYEQLTPVPNWSPDGSWLVYHKCVVVDSICNVGNNFDIYKLNVASGIETKLYDGGLYPYWP